MLVCKLEELESLGMGLQQAWIRFPAHMIQLLQSWTFLLFFFVIKHREGDDLADAKSLMISPVVFAKLLYRTAGAEEVVTSREDLFSMGESLRLLVDTPNFDG